MRTSVLLRFRAALVLATSIVACTSGAASRPAPMANPPSAPGPLTAANDFLAALRERDTAAVRRVVHPAFRLTTATEQNGGAALILSGDDFVRTLSRATGAPWNQRLLGPEVHVDGGLATIWSPYRFDRGATFDHCGVIALHLVRVRGEWKITQLSDTHRTTGCDA